MSKEAYTPQDSEIEGRALTQYQKAFKDSYTTIEVSEKIVEEYEGSYDFKHSMYGEERIDTIDNEVIHMMKGARKGLFNELTKPLIGEPVEIFVKPKQ